MEMLAVSVGVQEATDERASTLGRCAQRRDHRGIRPHGQKKARIAAHRLSVAISREHLERGIYIDQREVAGTGVGHGHRNIAMVRCCFYAGYRPINPRIPISKHGLHL
jgi:hypothetical protein